MRIGLSCFLLFALSACNIFAQDVFTKKWDRRFGGTLNDGFRSLIQTKDNGFIIGGTSESGMNGDRTEPSQGYDDMWIVKIDSNGNKQWDKRFGGTGGERLSKVRQTLDGGYILGGFSYSTISGDKTQSHRGGGDYWIVKVDSLGNKEWDRRFGGSSSDFLRTIETTRDNGFILGGLSNSGIGGDKTEDNWDLSYLWDDGWIVKVDSLGNKEWDKTLGGTDQDYIRAIVQANDGGFVVGLSSASDSSGNKTQASRGWYDYWIVKIDSLGNKIWDYRFGGGNTDYISGIVKTRDSGFLIGGDSNSGISGDRTQLGGQWIVKIDSSGNKQWDRAYNGGVGEFNNIYSTIDGGYLFTCRIGGTGSDKSEENLGTYQAWVVKIDSIGNKQWDKTIFTTGYDGYSEAIEISENCYVVAVSTSAGVGGYITEPNRDGIDSTGDFWIMKFCWEPVGIRNVDLESDILVYPNPFTSDLAISLQKENVREAQFAISNMQGQVVFTIHENNLASFYTKMLDLSYLPNGVYLVEVVTDNERVLKKVVKH